MPGRPHLSVQGQLLVIAVIHFWAGAGIGYLFDQLQIMIERVPVDKAERQKKRPMFALHVTLVIVLLNGDRRRGRSPPPTLVHVFMQRLLHVVHRMLFCVAMKQTVSDQNNVLLDAHTLHGGFAMIFGIAWTSGTTAEKLRIVFGTDQ